MFSAYHDEYCDYETFRAQCNSGQIIMMQSAVFGHMEVGKCIKTDIGFLGCKANVIDLLDERCSGKQQCELRVDDESLREFQPCVDGIELYLDAQFTCIKTIPPHVLCSPLPATSNPSYISSMHMLNKQCSSHSGLKIRASKGQMIELTIINVLPPDEELSTQEIGFVVDGDSSNSMPITLSDAEEVQIGTSKSSTVTVMVDDSHATFKFLIAYKGRLCQLLLSVG